LEVNSQPAHDTATNTEWQLPEVVLTQFFSPDDEHDVLETCRELKIKVNTQKEMCASCWSFTKNYPPVFHTSCFHKNVTQRQISDIKDIGFNVLDIQKMQ
jgi:hypothetical protein